MIDGDTKLRLTFFKDDYKVLASTKEIVDFKNIGK